MGHAQIGLLDVATVVLRRGACEDGVHVANPGGAPVLLSVVSAAGPRRRLPLWLKVRAGRAWWGGSKQGGGRQRG